MDPKYILVLAVVFVMGWFAAGVLINLRRGDAMLRWIQRGLPRIGERTTMRWLGTSVVELVIARAHKPFRRLETLIVLAPRDVPWMWLLAATQGRQDTLIFRAHLNVPPRIDFELADPTAWTGRMALNQASQKKWALRQDGSDHPEIGDRLYQGLQLMAPAGMLEQAITTLANLANPARGLAPHFWRLSIRREAPHLEVHIALPDRRSDAGQFIAALQELAQAVNENL
jgi:hypothetical protein